MSIDFKIYRDQNYMKYASNKTHDLIRKIKNDPADSPYFLSDLKDFILHEFKYHKLDELPEIIKKTIFFFGKGNYDEMYEILKPYFKN
ncbi:hypothetical protein [Aquimarina aggregata]|uniref:hypothetical protein n=1 Tax=Aquimarina aggregata TaxID=1642818 RepID=UPI00248F60BD|nr:hypothetical protein [Aquimarina aggregata]